MDELHQLQAWFEPMEITPQQKKRRCDLAFLLVDIFFYIISLIEVAKMSGATIEDSDSTQATQGINKADFVDMLTRRLTDALEEKDVDLDANRELKSYIVIVAEDIIETTLKNDTPYVYSRDRAITIAENEANSIENELDFIEAKKNGAKFKQWLTMKDERVRINHVLVDDVIIPIGDMFQVGEDNMRYPHDYINGSAENIINCRCSIKYFS